VEIPSQKRYIRHFETFLSCNFVKPYYKMIPNIIKDYFNPYKNKFSDIFHPKLGSDYKNKFKIHSIKIGPFDYREDINIDIEDILQTLKFSTKIKKNQIDYKYYIKEKNINGKRLNFVIVKFISNFIIDDDINIKINSKKNNFNFWVNFFYLSLEKYFFCIDKIFSLNLLMENKEYKLFTGEKKKKKNFNDNNSNNIWNLKER
jgi:hypothetical protein